MDQIAKSKPLLTRKILRPLPGAPTGVTSEIVSENSMELRWNPPNNPNGIILEYQITFRGYATGNETRLIDGPTTVNVLATPEPSTIITGLVPGLVYEFTVRARTAVGYGDSSSVVSVRLQVESDPVPVIEAINTSTVIIVCVSIAAVMVWIAIFILLTCMIRHRRQKSKRHQKVEYSLPLLKRDQSEVFTNQNVVPDHTSQGSSIKDIGNKKSEKITKL